MKLNKKKTRKICYAPKDLQALRYDRDLGDPGRFPFTRGIYPTMYAGKLWTMREFSGFGLAHDTNQRFRFLLASGQTGLSVAFDLPTLMGYDSDHPKSVGEVGLGGVAIDSLADMEELFSGIPLGEISTSMTINAPAAIVFAMYLACAKKQGVPFKRLNGTLQNDILKEFMAQKEWIFPPRPSVRLIVDTVGYAAKYVPKWNPISISGYHIREAGSTAAQELAFTLANGFTYVEEVLKTGLPIDRFAPRLSFFFNAHQNFFGEIAKYRAARRIWARKMRSTYKAKDPKSWRMRFHVQTAGSSLQAQQPENNIARTAFEALSAVLGGAQSLHTNGYDEPLCLPTQESAQIALRTQQILAHELGLQDAVDPLGGSYYLEQLTSEIEKQAESYFKQIRKMGGVLKGIEENFFQREIAGASYAYQKEVESKQQIVVGVNEYAAREELWKVPIFKIDPKREREQKAKLKRLRKKRSSAKVQKTLEQLKRKAHGKENLMPFILESVEAYATLGEIVSSLKEVFGEYQEPASAF
ncbi:MAG: methylmalonyl-CoA mutase [Candidatus Omnitrophica bacterium]|nr:methylmalonyl-CoA mutase [Candidatus Omnitrophota bacterium]